VRSKRWRAILIAVFLFAMMAEFSVRGPLRLLRGGMGWNDFLSPYIQSNAWVHGQDPYSPKSLVTFWPRGNSRPPWVDTEAANGTLETKRGIPSPYPLTSLVMVSPFTALSWPIALSLWTAISVAGVVLAALALISLCGCSLADPRSQLFVCALFALAPLHTGLATANPAILAVSLAVGSFWAARTGKDESAGVLLALAVCLKPTVAGGVLLYYLIRGRWRLVAISCAVAAAIGAFGVSRLALAGVHWIPSYFENARRIFTIGSVDDFSQADRLRFNMINAQVFFGSLFENASAAALLSQFLGVALFTCWVWLCYRRRTRLELLEISAVSILSLTAVYHRFYDAALLIWPLAWSLLLVGKRSITILTLALIAPFFVPGPILLASLAQSGRIPPAFTNGWWWNAIALPHEAWDLILLACLLLCWMGRESLENRERRDQTTE
jgi:hypothetical protein